MLPKIELWRVRSETRGSVQTGVRVRELLIGALSSVGFLQVRPHFASRAGGLFEKERDFKVAALVTDVACPRVGHGSELGAGFTTDNDPIDSSEVKSSEIFEERFKGHEFESGVAVTERINAV